MESSKLNTRAVASGGWRVASRRRTLRALVLVLVPLGAGGCRQQMAEQPRHDPLEASAFFRDGRAARPLVPGTVPRGHLREDEHLYTGKVGGKLVESFPFPVTKEILERGRERFNIYCSPCHDQLGTGEGMIVRRGFRQPPSYHTDRLRELPVGHFFDVMTNGFGAMPSYAVQIPVEDRWAIVAYIRALQLSQNAKLAELPAADRQKVQGTVR
jgi:mono/diheme cytochrome c family protein